MVLEFTAVERFLNEGCDCRDFHPRNPERVKLAVTDLWCIRQPEKRADEYHFSSSQDFGNAFLF